MNCNKKLKSNDTLEKLKSMTIVVADSGDISALKKFNPIDVTTNPSLILSAISLPEYKPIIEKAICWAQKVSRSKEEILQYTYDALNVFVGAEILKSIPGRISTEIDASLSFDKKRTIEKAIEIINLYKDYGVEKERVLIKLASTWEGIEAAKVLEKDHGIHCNMTLLFSMAQAVACADANVTLISPFVGRILDWYVKNTDDKSFESHNDPGVVFVRNVFNYYKHFEYKTQIMGASFRNIGEIKELAGCDLLTISPSLLTELENCYDELDCKLNAKEAKTMEIKKIKITEEKFRWMLNEDAMASEKLSDGIRKFAKDANIIKSKVQLMLEEKQK